MKNKKSGQKTAFVLFAVLFLIFGSILISPQNAKALTWTQVNTDGFGDAGNWGNLNLFIFQDKIYAAVGNALGGQMYRSSNGTTWEAITTNGFGDANNDEVGSFESFNGYLYAGTSNPTTGVEVWRSQTGSSGTWTQVNTDGFGNVNNSWIEGNSLVVFNSYLYVATSSNTVTGTEIWRTQDGTTWTQANTDGFGSASNTGVRAMKIYNNELYAGTFNAAGGKIFRTSNGTTWEEVVADGFGDANNDEICFLEKFGDYLYAGTINGTTGTELWRSSSGNSGTWTQANTDGFGNALNTWTGFQGAVVNGVFWLGTRRLANDAQLLYSTSGTSWTQEGADGFGDTNNYAIYAITFKERLYVGFSNGVTGVEIWRSGAGELTLLSLSPNSLPSGTISKAYNQTFSVSSGTSPYTFSYAGYLPPGVSLTSSGVLSGTPTQAGTYTFTITVTDSGTPAQTASLDYSIMILPVELPATGNGILNYLWLFGGIMGGVICLFLIKFTFCLKRQKS